MNELRRTKQKLALFDVEGCNGAMIDLLKTYDSDVRGGTVSEKEYLFYIEDLKRGYKEFIKENEKQDGKQGKLDI